MNHARPASNRRWELWLAPLAVLTLSTPAMANYLTSMMLVSSCQIYFGNILIGILEGLVIARLYDLPGKRSIGWMIGANYASMVAGMITVSFLVLFVEEAILGDDAFAHTPLLLAIMAVASFIITLLIEWPFCYRILAGQPDRFRKSIRADLVAQVISYALLIPGWLGIGSYGLATQVRVDPSVVTQCRDDATLYFVAQGCDRVCKCRLNGTHIEEVARFSPISNSSWLLLMRAAPTEPWQLRLRDSKDPTVLVRDVHGSPIIEAALEDHDDNDPAGEARIERYFASYSPIDYRPADQRAWKVHLTYPREITASNERTGEKFNVAMDAPFLGWRPQYGTLLPGDYFVFEMGARILLLDLNTRRLGMITRGHNPIVVPHSNPSTSSSHPSSR
jgi:hypothetical protein